MVCATYAALCCICAQYQAAVLLAVLYLIHSYTSGAHNVPQIRFLLLHNKQGKTRLSKWYIAVPEDERLKTEAEIHRIVATRSAKLANVVEVCDVLYYTLAPPPVYTGRPPPPTSPALPTPHHLLHAVPKL